MNVGSIYVIKCHVTNKAYVGQTIKPLHFRFATHVRCALNGGETHLARAIKKYGAEAFTIELLETCDNSTLNSREEHWIRTLGTKDDGYNETYGGEGVKGYEHNQRRKQLMSDHHWSRRQDAAEIKARIAKSRAGWHPTPEAVEKTASKNRGTKRSAATRALQSQKASGSNNPMFGTLSPNRRAVEQLTLDGVHVAFHDSITAAIRALGVKSAAIAGCCAGKHKTSHGFVWRFTCGASIHESSPSDPHTTESCDQSLPRT